MADDETPTSKQSKLREARRKRILANAEARMNKLKGLQARHSSNEPAPVNPSPVIPLVPQPSPTVDTSPSLDTDPPDEIIIPRPPEQAPPIAPFLVQQAPPVNPPPRPPLPSSWLSVVVGDICSAYGYKLRTGAALLCVLFVTIGNVVLGGFRVSYVLSILILDCTLTLWLVRRPGAKFSNTNPLGWWSMANIPLSFLHPSLPRLFETICLTVLLLNAFLRDILFVVFCSVISVACVHAIL